MDEPIYRLLVAPGLRKAAVEHFLIPPHSPAKPMQILCDSNYICIAAVNVIHCQAYEQADPEAYNAYVKAHGDKRPVTIETTYGIVRMCAGETLTIFVSPITDRYKCFAEDVDPQGQRNQAASNNSGVAVALFLRELDKEAQWLIKIR